MAELADMELQKQEGSTGTDSNPVLSDFSVNTHWVVPGIEEILKENPQLTFTPGDVYTSCVYGDSDLWTTDEGFVVTTRLVDTFSEDTTLLIWLAWAKTRGNNLVVKHQDFFLNRAKKAGYKKLEVRSAVPGLAPYILKNGWDVDTVVYTRDV